VVVIAAPYPRRGSGEASCETAGSGPQSGLPTGTIARGAMPFTAPAAYVYQATAAVTIPAQPTWSM
jgi:hypothetical protein